MSKSKFPLPAKTVPFEYERFLEDTADIDIGAAGVLAKLQCLFWRMGGPLVDNDRILGEAIGISRQRFCHLKRQLIEADLLYVENGRLVPFDAMPALVKANIETERRSMLGTKGAHARWHRADAEQANP